MRKIPLTQGKFAIVDDEDYEWLNQWKWYAHRDSKNGIYYARRGIWKNNKVKTILMHREIMNPLPGIPIDHINHKGFDNRRCNLRICSHAQNQWNQKNPKGYYWHRGKYLAKIRIGNGRQISLGHFHTTEEAHSTYLNAKKQYHTLQNLSSKEESLALQGARGSLL